MSITTERPPRQQPPAPPGGPRIVRVQVTQSDILLGEAGSSVKCPVARAMTRALKEPVYVFTSYATRKSAVEFPPAPDSLEWKLPAHVRLAVFNFDNFGCMLPVAFRVEVM